MIILADIWLHLATIAIPFVQVTLINPPEMSYGRGLSPTCLSANVSSGTGPNSTYALPCSILNTPVAGAILGASESYKTVNNLSTSNRIFSVDNSDGTFALLGDAQASDERDFVAATIAVNTKCIPITRKCNLRTNISTQFNCSPVFSGDLFLASAVFPSSFLTILR